MTNVSNVTMIKINVNGVAYETVDSVVRNLVCALDGEPLSSEHRDTRAIKELVASRLNRLVKEDIRSDGVNVNTSYIPGRRYQVTVTALTKGTTC